MEAAVVAPVIAVAAEASIVMPVLIAVAEVAVVMPMLVAAAEVALLLPALRAVSAGRHLPVLLLRRRFAATVAAVAMLVVTRAGLCACGSTERDACDCRH